MRISEIAFGNQLSDIPRISIFVEELKRIDRLLRLGRYRFYKSVEAQRTTQSFGTAADLDSITDPIACHFNYSKLLNERYVTENLLDAPVRVHGYDTGNIQYDRFNRCISAHRELSCEEIGDLANHCLGRARELHLGAREVISPSIPLTGQRYLP